MDPERQAFMNLRDKPKILTAQETAWYLGVSPMALLAAARQKILQPLAHKSLNQNCTKYYSRCDLDNLTREDMARIIKAAVEYNRERNQKQETEFEEQLT